jgi:hypothetical protein
MTESTDDLVTDRSDHPDDLLAGLADGTLDEPDRARVESHLASCADCRRELDLARRGAAAMSTLPALDAPPGLTRGVVDRARPARIPRRWALVAAPAAAAVVALAVWAAVAGGGGGGGGSVASGASGGGGGAAVQAESGPADSRVHVSNVNFTAARIQALAADLASNQARQDLLSRKNAPAPTAAGKSRTARFTGNPIGCIQATAHPTKGDQLLEVLVARFDGTPAFVAVFVHHPGAGQPANLLTIWVASQHGCRLLHYASQPLGR